MIAPASPLRIPRHSFSADDAESSALERLRGGREPGRLANMAGGLFLLALTAVSGSALYAFARGPAAAPWVSASSR